MSDDPLSTIGWREWITLPGFEQTAIKAKVDTGARTSALHAFYVEPFEHDGQPWVRFGLHPRQGESRQAVHCQAPLHDRRPVTDSGGHREQRYVILAQLSLGGQAFDAELTLTDRDTMRFRMLLGRQALKGRYRVDPGQSFLAGGNTHTPPKEGSEP